VTAALRLGAYERWWQDQPVVPGATLPEKLANLESLGYELIQLTRNTFQGVTGVDDAVAQAVKSAFRASTIRPAVAGVGGPSLAAATPAERAEGVRALERGLRIAAEIGAIGSPLARSHAMPDLSPRWSANELASEMVVDGLRRVAPLARDLGVSVLVEPLNRYESTYIQTLADAAELCEAVGGGTLKILADFYHMNLEESDLEAAVLAAGPHIGFVHVCDSNRCEPGTGHADLKPLFRGLMRIGYPGYTSLECRVLAEDRMAMLAGVRDLLRAEWAAA